MCFSLQSKKLCKTIAFRPCSYPLCLLLGLERQKPSHGKVTTLNITIILFCFHLDSCEIFQRLCFSCLNGIFNVWCLDDEVNVPFCVRADLTRKSFWNYAERLTWDRDGIVGDILFCNFCVLIESLLPSEYFLVE